VVEHSNSGARRYILHECYLGNTEFNSDDQLHGPEQRFLHEDGGRKRERDMVGYECLRRQQTGWDVHNKRL
jgi:hypothetical protein